LDEKLLRHKALRHKALHQKALHQKAHKVVRFNSFSFAGPDHTLWFILTA
jgi:hypothetical protein